MSDYPWRIWEGNKAMQGRWQDYPVDTQYLANWVFGILRNECRNPEQARDVLRKIADWMDKRYPEDIKAALLDKSETAQLFMKPY